MQFTTVGRPYTEGREQQIVAMCDAMQWREIPRDGSRLELGMMPAMAIKSAIQQCGLVNVTHVAVAEALAPYGLLGIRCHNGPESVEAFLVDAGDEVVVVCHR
ncbi:MAG: hypothetical protein AMXMBFR13_06940 [Phycisphaerae bacterium]